jgi:hypothetical protein
LQPPTTAGVNFHFETAVRTERVRVGWVLFTTLNVFMSASPVVSTNTDSNFASAVFVEHTLRKFLADRRRIVGDRFGNAFYADLGIRDGPPHPFVARHQESGGAMRAGVTDGSGDECALHPATTAVRTITRTRRFSVAMASGKL